MADDEAFPVTGTRYVIVPRWVMELGLHEAAVYMAVSSYMNEEHFGWPSHPKIAARAGVSEKTVRRVLPILEEAGAISKVKRFREDGGRSSNGYYVALDPPVPQTRGGGPTDQGPPVPGTDEVEPVEVEPNEEDGSPNRPVTTGLELRTGSSGTPARAREASEGERHARDLCFYLAAKIEMNGCRKPTVTRTWEREARLLVDKDGIQPGEVRAAIDWATSHHFWKANILSMPKLRHHFDRLRLQARAERAAPSPTKAYDAAMESLREMAESS